MHPRTTMSFLATACLAFLGLQAVAAQDDRPNTSPLAVTTQFAFGPEAECQRGEGLLVQLHYSGSQPLRGYLVKFVFGDTPAGKPPQMQVLEEARSPGQAMIAPDEEWTRTLCSTPQRETGEVPKVASTVDMLKFADGSTWGPRALRQSHELIGRLDGFDFLTKTTELQRFVSPILPELGPLPKQQIEFLTIGPLKLESGIWRDPRGQEMLVVKVTNQGPTAIRGYLLGTTFFDPETGATIRRASTKQLETRGNPADYLAPGASWIADPRRFSYLPNGALAAYRITLDLVAFADGTTYGPLKSSESSEVLGMIQGIDAAKEKIQDAASTKHTGP
jgi:hypothetical protein